MEKCASVIEWFKNIEDKKNCTLIKFDIIEFYPPIAETILDKALLQNNITTYPMIIPD